MVPLSLDLGGASMPRLRRDPGVFFDSPWRSGYGVADESDILRRNLPRFLGNGSTRYGDDPIEAALLLPGISAGHGGIRGVIWNCFF